MKWVDWYRNKHVVVTGGLGFIGSNLAHRLVSLGARVRIVDAALPGSGANPHNLDDIRDSVEIWEADLRDPTAAVDAISGQAVLFNLAAQTSHIASMEDPVNDLAINAGSHLNIVEACRQTEPAIKIVYTATRQMYGRSCDLPIDETHPIDPVDYNGVSKRAGEMFHLVAHRAYGLNVTSLRLTNTYGPRMRCFDARLMFLGEWIRRLLVGQPLLVYGSGDQIRDFTYVDDVVDALLAAAAHPDTNGQIYNLGGSEPIRLADLARLVIDLVGSGSVEYVPYPADRLRIDIGDYHGDFSRLQATLAWTPRVSLRDGLRRTVDFVDRHRAWYL